ncbi:hypothetical protein [Mycobacterium sp.]|uniref:hypothetical protein n=1 Tax=Mycobacterium sp. TaxID=1785 RepID=UPI003BAA2077
MESADLRIDVGQLRAMASQWDALGTELGVSVPRSSGQLFQPTAAAVGSADTTVGLAAGALAARAQATTCAVAAGAGGYVTNEATSAAEMTAVGQSRVV